MGKISGKIINFVCLALLTLALCPVAKASQLSKFDYLLYVYDLDGKAIAYQRHCIDDDVSRTFKKTDKVVVNALVAEAIRKNPQVTPSFIREEIDKRRKDLEFVLDHKYKVEDCSGPEIEKAKAQYSEMSSHSPRDIKAYLQSRSYN